MSPLDLRRGAPVVLYLHTPKEKVWGVLLSIEASGIALRGIDLVVFDDWLRQEARGDETLLGPTTLFYPMGRVERMERDETVGPMTSYAERFAREVGRTAFEAVGLVGADDDEADDGADAGGRPVS